MDGGLMHVKTAAESLAGKGLSWAEGRKKKLTANL